MKINNMINNPKWKKFFKHNSKNINCQHCKYEKAIDSIPKVDFIIKVRNNPMSKTDFSTKNRTISEVTLIIGSHDDIIGWKF